MQWFIFSSILFLRQFTIYSQHLQWFIWLKSIGSKVETSEYWHKYLGKLRHPMMQCQSIHPFRLRSGYCHYRAPETCHQRWCMCKWLALLFRFHPDLVNALNIHRRASRVFDDISKFRACQIDSTVDEWNNSVEHVPKCERKKHFQTNRFINFLPANSINGFIRDSVSAW